MDGRGGSEGAGGGGSVKEVRQVRRGKVMMRSVSLLEIMSWQSASSHVLMPTSAILSNIVQTAFVAAGG